LIKNRRFWFKLSVALCIAILLAPPAVANITPTRISGGVDPETEGWSNIIMEQEHVSLKVNPAVCLVTGTYWLKNPKGPKTEEMAFPFDHRFPDDLNNFRAWVDDKPVETKVIGHEYLEKQRREEERRRQAEARKQGLVAPTGGGTSGGEGFEAWNAWEVKFAKGARRKISVAYEAAPRRVDDYQFERELKPKKSNGSIDEADTILMLQAEGNDIQAKYDIFTGGRWNGKIRQGLFEAEITTPKNWTLSLDPKPNSVVGRKHTWLCKNFKPSFNGGISEIIIKFHPKKISNNEKANIYKALSRRHLNEFDFTSKITNELVSLGYPRDAEAIRFQSIKLWKPTDFDRLTRAHEDVTAPRELDGALLMACQTVSSFDSNKMNEQATQCARVVQAIVQAAVKEGYQRSTVLSELDESAGGKVRDVCLKYGIDLDEKP
jgi:hypothetical protein